MTFPADLQLFAQQLVDPDPITRIKTAGVLLSLLRHNRRTDVLDALDAGHDLQVVAGALHSTVAEMQSDLAAWASIDPESVTRSLPYLTPELIECYRLDQPSYGDQP